MLRQRFAQVFSLILAISCVSPAQADFDKLLQKIPADANGLVMIRANKIFNSPMAKELGWKMGIEEAVAEQPLIVPRGTRRLVVGTQFNLASMEPMWEFAVVDMKAAPSMNKVTRMDGGFVDHFGNVEAAWTPLNTYYLRLSDHIVGAAFPADRQRVASWVKQGQSAKADSLRSYLNHGAEFADKGADIVMVLDLKQALSPQDAARRLEDFDALAGKEDMLESLAGIISKIRGVTLRVEVGKNPSGKITIHFNEDASKLSEIAKPLFLEVLARSGSNIDDLADWKVSSTSTGKTIVLKGGLSTQGMRRLLSMSELPMPSGGAAADQQAKGADDKDPKATASRKYFKAVTTLLADLREKRAGSTLGHTDAVWFGRYARKIYRLPILNVDEDMQEYGAQVAGRLLDAVDVIEGHSQQAKADMAGVHGGGKYYGGKRYAVRRSGGYSYGGRDSYSTTDGHDARQENRDRRQQMTADRIKRINERKKIRKEALAKGTVEARAIIDGLRDMTIAIRREMTNRYGIEF